jgi:hypothetical protein
MGTASGTGAGDDELDKLVGAADLAADAGEPILAREVMTAIGELGDRLE